MGTTDLETCGDELYSQLAVFVLLNLLEESLQQIRMPVKDFRNQFESLGSEGYQKVLDVVARTA